MPGKLLLLNDDEPGQFDAREITVVRTGIRIGDQEGVLAAIAPPIETATAGELEFAILVPRHRDITAKDIARGVVPNPASVFVCSFLGTADELPADLAKDEVSIVFWGRLFNK